MRCAHSLGSPWGGGRPGPAAGRGAPPPPPPTTVAYFLALVVGQPATLDGWGAALLFAAGALGASAAWQLLLVGGGAALGRTVTGRGGRLVLAVGSGVIVLALALRLLVAG
jgi:hypothetical protein